MRILVISDVHANYPALAAVREAAGPVDEIWCLGDLVGYGPDPNAVVEEMRNIPNLTCILGNHDLAAIGMIPLTNFDGEALRTIERHERELTLSNKEYLRSLPHELIVLGEVSLAHGSPRDSISKHEYIVDPHSARLNFDYFTTPWCFVGHWHRQCLFQLDLGTGRIDSITVCAGEQLVLRPRAILNPGSVGQPRDGDPRAAYAIYHSDTHTWEARGVMYDKLT